MKTSMTFTPHITVACIVEDQQRFLCVREISKGQVVLEANESLLEAAVRETLEETGWQVELSHVIGSYLFLAPNGVTYQRVCFAAKPIQQQIDAVLSPEIIAPEWLTREQLLKQADLWRSPLLMRCIDDYLAGANYPLSLFKSID